MYIVHSIKNYTFIFNIIHKFIIFQFSWKSVLFNTKYETVKCRVIFMNYQKSFILKSLKGIFTFKCFLKFPLNVFVEIFTFEII